MSATGNGLEELLIGKESKRRASLWILRANRITVDSVFHPSWSVERWAFVPTPTVLAYNLTRKGNSPPKILCCPNQTKSLDLFIPREYFMFIIS